MNLCLKTYSMLLSNKALFNKCKSVCYEYKKQSPKKINELFRGLFYFVELTYKGYFGLVKANYFILKAIYFFLSKASISSTSVRNDLSTSNCPFTILQACSTVA